MSRRPMRRADLVAGCRAAIRARRAGKRGIRIGERPAVRYEQFQFEKSCGTAACVHGFACLAAGEPISPAGGLDYADIERPVQNDVFDIIWDPSAERAPERILKLLGETP